MKKIVKVGSVVLFGVAFLQASNVKIYEIKSGKVTYEIKENGNIMGMSKINSIGKKRLIFDNFGATNLVEKSKVRKETTMGKTNVKKNHTLTYMNGAVLYNVNFNKKQIIRMKNPGFSLAISNAKNAKERSEKLLKQMGGKKVGKGKVLGYECDIWSIMGIKQCIYKGIPLKIESNVMGLKSVEVATKAEFDISIDSDSFKLPNFPIYSVNIGSKPVKIDKSRLKELDAKDNAQGKADAKEYKDKAQAMKSALEEAKKAGFDPKSGKDMTKEQQNAMLKGMMNAMGGESAMVKRAKQEILQEADGAIWAKDCFSSANNKKEANSCVDKGNQKFPGEKMDYVDSWNKNDKQKMLKEINQFIDAIPCIKKAEKMQDLQKCMK